MIINCIQCFIRNETEVAYTGTHRSIAASELFITQGTSTYAMQFYLGQKSHRRQSQSKVFVAATLSDK